MFGVWCLVFGVWCLVFGVWGSMVGGYFEAERVVRSSLLLFLDLQIHLLSRFGFRVLGFVFRFSGIVFRVSSSGFRVPSFGSRISRFGNSFVDDLALFGELDAVGKNVEEDLSEPVRIADHIL